MRHPRIAAVITLGALAAGATLASRAIAAQGTMTAGERANAAVAMEWWDKVVEGGSMADADRLMAEDYIQHNPSFNTGRAAFKAVFGRGGPPRNNPAIVVVARGRYVALRWQPPRPPNANGPSPAASFFELVRVEDGRIVEHWDSGVRGGNPPPGQPRTEVTPGYGPRPVGPPLSAAERATQGIADTVLRDIFQYGHFELADTLIASDYIEHDPNAGTGRQGLVNYIRMNVPQAPLSPLWKDEPELVLTSGDTVLYMMKRFSRDPFEPAKVYKWSWFEQFRVSDGMVREHWNLGAMPGSPQAPPPTVPKPAGFREYQ